MTEAVTTCAAIVLAAGASTRLGQPKQLLRIDGETLLRRTVRFAIDAGCLPVFVVLGCDATVLTPQLEGLAASAIINDQWQTGMASSLQAGLHAALDTSPSPADVMILVCDQPRLDASLLHSLLATHASQRSTITASRYLNTLGAPAIFSSAHFRELLELTGDQGARRILQQHRETVAAIDFPGGGFDIDTPEDLTQLNL
jgi:molybdenum cofactor cytidylyltransferase